MLTTTDKNPRKSKKIILLSIILTLVVYKSRYRTEKKWKSSLVAPPPRGWPPFWSRHDFHFRSRIGSYNLLTFIYLSIQIQIRTMQIRPNWSKFHLSLDRRSTRGRGPLNILGSGIVLEVQLRTSEIAFIRFSLVRCSLVDGDCLLSAAFADIIQFNRLSGVSVRLCVSLISCCSRSYIIHTKLSRRCTTTPQTRPGLSAILCQQQKGGLLLQGQQQQVNLIKVAIAIFFWWGGLKSATFDEKCAITRKRYTI